MLFFLVVHQLDALCTPLRVLLLFQNNHGASACIRRKQNKTKYLIIYNQRDVILAMMVPSMMTTTTVILFWVLWFNWLCGYIAGAELMTSNHVCLSFYEHFHINGCLQYTGQ